MSNSTQRCFFFPSKIQPALSISVCTCTRDCLLPATPVCRNRLIVSLLEKCWSDPYAPIHYILCQFHNFGAIYVHSSTLTVLTHSWQFSTKSLWPKLTIALYFFNMITAPSGNRKSFCETSVHRVLQLLMSMQRPSRSFPPWVEQPAISVQWCAPQATSGWWLGLGYITLWWVLVTISSMFYIFCRYPCVFVVMNDY
jgi:hypothetical protein